MANTVNFQFYVGEDLTVACALSPVVDISGWSLQFTVRPTAGSPTAYITKTTGGSGITITNGPLSLFTITLASADTSVLLPGTYNYDIQRTGSGVHRELMIGTLTLVAPVTPIVSP